MIRSNVDSPPWSTDRDDSELPVAPPRRPRGGDGSSGFTLIEVLVALGILTMGISSAIALFAAAGAAHKRAIDRTHAVTIAEQVLADVENQLARGRTAQEVNDSPPLDEIQRLWPDYRAEARILSLSPDEILVRIVVFLTVRGDQHHEVFEQILLSPSASPAVR